MRRLDDDEDVTLAQFLVIFRDRRLLPIYAVIVLNMFLVGILFGFLPVYLHGIGYSAIESGTVLSVATAAYLLVQPMAGALADRFDTRTTVIAGLILLKPSFSTSMRYGPGPRFGRKYSPEALVVAPRRTFVSVAIALTVASATTAPEASVTRPLSEAFVD
jgi:MFS family permease